jgi:hypothetical protein
MGRVPPQDDRLNDRLRAWTARPRAKANRIVVACAALSVLWLLMASEGAPDRASMLRQAALLFFAFHSVTYVVWLRTLRRFAARGRAEAKGALAAYTDPRRLTNLDLAMFWVAFSLLVPHIA